VHQDWEIISADDGQLAMLLQRSLRRVIRHGHLKAGPLS
jgi:hypothetical protein